MRAPQLIERLRRRCDEIPVDWSCLPWLDPAGADPCNAYMWSRERDAPPPLRSRRWLEWWYLRGRARRSGDSLYLAQGVINPAGAPADRAAHAFVALGLPRRGLHVMRRFPTAAFAASPCEMNVETAGCRATASRLVGHLEHDGRSLDWDLRVARRWRVPAAAWAMRLGRLSSVHWFPAQADARLSGRLTVDGEAVTLDDDPGYQDHNWGVAFPRWWMWIACNDFDGHPDSALVVGGGRPALFRALEVDDLACVGLRHEGRVRAFRSFHFHATRMTPIPGGWLVEIGDRRERLFVTARAPRSRYFRIDLPTPEGGVFHNHETLDGDCEVVLEERRGGTWRETARLTSRSAGIEIGGHPGQASGPWPGRMEESGSDGSAGR